MTIIGPSGKRAALAVAITVALSCLTGCPQKNEGDKATKPADPYAAEIAAVRQRIAELQAEYEQNRAKLKVDLKAALDKAQAANLDSDALMQQVADLTRTVADNTRQMEALTQKLREQMKAAGIQ